MECLRCLPADSVRRLQAKSQGNSDMIDRLDVRCRLVELQQRLVSNLEASSPQVLPCLLSCSDTYTDAPEDTALPKECQDICL